MGDFFYSIYRFFLRNRFLLWLIIGTTTILMAFATFKLRYVEDITSFFPQNKSDVSLIFKTLKAKDKIALMFTADGHQADIDTLIDCAEDFYSLAKDKKGLSENTRITISVNDTVVETASKFVFDNLPLFLNEDDYNRLDSITSPDAIKARMKQNYANLLSPMGGYITDIVAKDPLGLGGDALKELQNQGNNFKFSLIDNYIFSLDNKTLIAYVEPLGEISNEVITRSIEDVIEELDSHYPNVKIEFFGAPAVAAYNASQIKTDSMITLNIAILLVAVFITLVFRNKFTVFLVMMPVLYGALFALAIIYLISGEISLIAVGSGSIILGVALSYSIHILSHTNHCRDMRQLLNELAYPLTIGSITTIGAFIGLLFTNSRLLQDFGLFAALTLVGTTIFALIFLPHFVSLQHEERPAGKLLSFIDRVTNLKLDRNKYVVVIILLFIGVCALFYNKVEFDSDMMNLNYMPAHLAKAEKRLNSFVIGDTTQSNVMFIASGPSADVAAERYGTLCDVLDSLQNQGFVNSVSSVHGFVVPQSVQLARLEKWNNFWTPEKQSEVLKLINQEGEMLGFENDGFAGFERIINKQYQLLDYEAESSSAQVFPDWISPSQSLTSFVAQVKLHAANKEMVYDKFAHVDGVIAADRGFFAGKLAEDVNHNFNLVLYISGFLIFFVLLLSFGRLEITLMSFLPMLLSWIVILGIMAMVGIQFNIVTIILSTFIFGIGDDFSIFIMDGLQSDYKDRSPILEQHKTAIFFSAFTIIVGMGALIFAGHPAMKPLGIISLIGIIVVVLMAYIIQPFIFRLLVTSQTEKGGFPFTMMAILNTAYAFGLFVIGSLILQLLILITWIPFVGEKRIKYLIHKITSLSARFFLKVMITTRFVKEFQNEEDFKTPAVVIANHQSFIDILVMLALQHKIVMVTNGWVWKSPVFGRIVRYLDFYHAQNGYEELAESLKPKIEQGYSVVIFPEGTRSECGKIGRFHKGAFYLAEMLKLDILPVLLYGNNLVSSKRQPFYIKKGLLVASIMPRITPQMTEYGDGYSERSKKIAQYIKNEYDNLYERYNRVDNFYFKDAIIKNYIYKGPVLEWYMRIKLRLENWYDEYDRILPRKGYIVDLGCGYGAMSYMLMMLSDKRKITGVDYDEEKIALASNSFLKNENINFIASDIRTYDIPAADAYVISDVLHYMDEEMQRSVIQRCIDRLNVGGVLLIRDGDSSVTGKHKRTVLTEKWSTKIVKFNKTDGPLCFLSRDMIADIAGCNNMDLSISQSDSSTSNTMFILTKK